MQIQCKEVSKSYKMGAVSVHALDRINCVIDRQECVAIVGPSGSGKTTFLDILGCLSRPTSGDYLLNGETIQNLSDRELARIRNKTFGFIFQTFHLLGRHTALGNVELPLFYSGLSKGARSERAKEALVRVGLEDRMHHRPAELSGGQQQRVAIARALVNNPEIILADEPTGNLDSKSGKEIFDLLLALNQQGHTLILVSHDREMANVVKRTLTIKDGQITNDICKPDKAETSA